MKVAVVGCGYVGLVSAVGLATVGHHVVGIEIDPLRLEALERGQTPFAEPGLEDGLRRALDGGHIEFAPSLEASSAADVVLLCVQTPPTSAGSVDLRYLEEAAASLALVLRESPDSRRVIAIRSTVPPGTNERLVEVLGHIGAAVVSNPEFLREGSALEDFLHADRVVLGVREAWAVEVMQSLYDTIDAPVIVTTPETAELAKYASNALLATLVSFSNEVAGIAEGTPGVDVEAVLGIVHRDRRFRGAPDEPASIVSYLKAGCGYGGSCLPKDLAALTAYALSLGEQAPLLSAVADVNRRQACRLVDMVERELAGLDRKPVAVLGAAFKAGTDDLRESPALRVAEELLRRGAAVIVYDPLVERSRLEAALPHDSVEVVETLEAAIAASDACVVTTLDPVFDRLPDLVLAQNGASPIVVDGRRALAPDRFTDGSYSGVGLGAGR